MSVDGVHPSPHSSPEPEPGRMQGLLDIARDAAVRDVQALVLSELISFLAREITQPLTAVITNAQACSRLITSRATGPAGLRGHSLEEVKTALGEIARDGTRASDLVKEVRAQLDPQGSDRQSLDMNRAVASVLSVVEPALSRNAIEVENDLGPDLPPVSGPPARIEALLHMLVANAIEAMETAPNPVRRRLVVRSRLDGRGHVCVTVQDNGPGIAFAVADRVFEMFTTTKPGHLGLGLWAARSIVRSYGGALQVGAEQAGTISFHLTLPPCR